MKLRATQPRLGLADCPLVGVEEIREASARVAGVVRSTPVDHSDTLSRLAGRPILLKPEHLQRTGSFKIRGAYNRISRIPAGSEVVAASAGNHAQGVALAASLTGLPATIFMPTGATVPKVEATRSYGASIRHAGDSVDDAIAAARAFAAERGAVFVPPFDCPLIIAGQGTVGLELAEEAPHTETVVVPVGGGGLIAGISSAVKALLPGVRVVGVEAAGAASMCASIAAGRAVQLPRVDTMADGIALKAPSELTLAHVLAQVDDVVTVTEEEISQAALLLLERAKSVVEPSGATTLAAVLHGKVAGTGPVVCVLSGGNVDPLVLIKIIDHGLSAAGRYMVVRVVLDDRPGALASLTAEVAKLGLNVLSAEHHRSGLALGYDEVEVVLTLETRNALQQAEVVRDLQASRFRVEPVS